MKSNEKIPFYKILLAVVILIFTASCDNPKLFATLTTSPVTNVTLTTATSGGSIIDDNNAKVTSEGVCWSTKSNPTISDSKTTSMTVTTVFTSLITGLLPNTTYHVRAYLTNSDGTVYGNEVTFTTPQGDILALTTTTPTGITANAATAGGNITSDGGSTVTARGVCWNTSAVPTISNSKTSDGTGTGDFTSSLTDLLPGTVYYLRAYATNATGTAYGNEVTFTTLQGVTVALTTTVPTGIATTAATSGGNITSDGGLVITARGVCWSTSTAPTINNSKTSDGTGTGIFTSNLTGLQPNTKYYLRAYATNLSGTTYGNEVSFTTMQTAVLTLTTTTPTGIGLNTATAGGNITSDGGSTVTARGVCWNTATSPTISNSKTTDGTGTGIFISSLIGLQAGTTYYLRAYATNATGTVYGNEVTFTTSQATAVVLTTTAPTGIATTAATSGGNIISDGGLIITARGVCWSTSTAPTTSNSKTSDGTGMGVFTSNLTGLQPNTKYYLRAYATNLSGTTYGNEVSFTTAQTAVLTLTTTAATAIGLNTATAGGNVTSDGGSTVTARGVCWSTSTAPTASNSKTTDGTGTGTFISSLIGLQSGTTYYLRAYATNANGTVYGNEVTFTTTQIVMPALTTTAATAIALTTATAGGNITSDGGSTVTARGVCWSTSTGPTISNSKTSDGTGTGVFTSSLTGLQSGTTYYLRAYATNSIGTAYGNEISFTTTQNVIPTLTTTAATAIALTTATSGGNVTSDGGSTVTARGVCWNTATAPTISNSKTSDGTGTGSFTSSLTGLVTGTKYYVRAYATNSIGTAYGNEVSFTTTTAVVNTAGTLTVSVLTSTAGGGYAPRNVMAIWIEDNSGIFVKTLLAYAATRINDLTNWVANSSKNVVDATTGATQSSHTTRTATWNATNISGVVVPDGVYKVCMELTDKNGTGNFSSFTFTKGPTAVTLTPTNVASFSNISIVWTPK